MKNLAIATFGITFFLVVGGQILIRNGFFNNTDNGIVILNPQEHNGWNNGVAFCGEEKRVIVYDLEDHFWYDKDLDISFTINKGHKNDLQVIELTKLAIQECKKLKEKQNPPKGE